MKNKLYIYFKISTLLSTIRLLLIAVIHVYVCTRTHETANNCIRNILIRYKLNYKFRRF